MKKLTLVILVCMLMLISITTVACNHVHTFSDKWESDKIYHWHEATCGHKDEINDRAMHAFDENNRCRECGYEQKVQVQPPTDKHEHTFSDEWTSDDTSHWYAATCGHNAIKDMEKHRFDSDNLCIECNYDKITKQPGHRHTFSDDWSGDNTYHWHAATCGHSAVSDKKVHSYGEDYICSECGYTMVLQPNPNPSDHEHTFSDEWTFDEMFHWRKATCEHTHIEIDYAVHNFGADNKCTVCGCDKHEHTFSDEWTFDETYHWYEATCGHPYATKDYAVHNFGADNKCTVCGCDKHEHTFSDEWTFDEACHWHEATCGHSYETKDRAGHSLGADNKCPECGSEVWATEGLEYELNNDESSYSVVGIGSAAETYIVIPAVYNGKPVTSIGEMAFYDCSSLVYITIPDSVTSIGKEAFRRCYDLENVTIPDSVTSLGEGAFESCNKLTSVKLSNNLTSIENNTFWFCGKLESITIPDSVTSIGENAFISCRKLESIIIPDSVTSIGENAFNDCDNLKSIVIGSGVTSIGGSAFRGCERLESITVSSFNTVYHSTDNCLIQTTTKTLLLGCKSSIIPTDGSVTIIGDYAFYGCEDLENITIPEGVTSIGSSAFNMCYGIESVIIPDSVTSIGLMAFGYCWNLKSITIGSGITSIGSDMFYGCDGLESILVSEANTIYHSDGNCLIKTATKTLVLGCKASVIPTDGSVTIIGSEAFYGRYNLESIEIPDSITHIEEKAFFGCRSLKSVVIGSGVISIGSRAFSWGMSLDNIYYNGTKEDWENISIGSNNDGFDTATVYYYSESAPTDDGNYWHYDNGEVSIWSN